MNKWRNVTNSVTAIYCVFGGKCSWVTSISSKVVYQNLRYFSVGFGRVLLRSGLRMTVSLLKGKDLFPSRNWDITIASRTHWISLISCKCHCVAASSPAGMPPRPHGRQAGSSLCLSSTFDRNSADSLRRVFGGPNRTAARGIQLARAAGRRRWGKQWTRQTFDRIVFSMKNSRVL